MPSFKPILRVLQAAVPVLYCGGLCYYFLDQTGSVENAEAVGLGPTLLGLGAIGLMFAIWLAVKLTWVFAHLPRRGGNSPPPDDDGFDADAVIARHLARRPAEEPRPVAPATAPRPAPRPGFGRRNR